MQLTSSIGGLVKSIQRGTVAIAISGSTGTATISSINTARSVCHFGGYSDAEPDTFAADGNSLGANFVRVDITSATQITATRDVTGHALTVAYTVVEYF